MEKFKKLTLWKKVLLIIVGIIFLPIIISALIIYYSTKGIIKFTKNKKSIVSVVLIIPELIGILFLFLSLDLYKTIIFSDNNSTQVVSTDNKVEAEKVDVTDNNKDTSNKDENKEKIENNNEQKDNNTKEYSETLPDYEVVSVDDTSIPTATRKTLNIVVTGKYTLDELYKIAEKEIYSYTSNNKVNALTVGFFTDKKHIGKGYDMGRVEYVPNGNFSDAVNVKAGDYSKFEIVKYLEEPIQFEKGESIKEGKSDLNKIKKDFQEVYGDNEVSVKLKDDTLYVNIVEAEDQKFFSADENAISTYTDFSLDNIKGDIKYLDITVNRPSSSASATLDMSQMQTDNGRYFETDYIRENLK